MRIALVLVALLSVSCAGESEEIGQEGTITGVVTSIESSGLNDVTSFELRHEGDTTTVYIDDKIDYGFPLGHLNAHMTGGEPVRVETMEREGKLYASSIEDA